MLALLRRKVTGGAEIISRNGRMGVLVFDEPESHTKVRVGSRAASGKEKARPQT